MVALRKQVKQQQIVDQLKYWRDIRLDSPARKAEALHNIDNLLDELLKERNSGT